MPPPLVRPFLKAHAFAHRNLSDGPSPAVRASARPKRRLPLSGHRVSAQRRGPKHGAWGCRPTRRPPSPPRRPPRPGQVRESPAAGVEKPQPGGRVRRSRCPPASREGPRAALWAGHTSVRARHHWPGGPGVCGRGGARRRARSWSRLKGAARRRWASSAGSASPASWLCAAASRGSSAGGRTRGCGCPGGRTRWRWWAPRSPGGRWAPGRAGGPQPGDGRRSLTRPFFFVWQKRRGVDHGPATLRAAGLVERLAGLGEAPRAAIWIVPPPSGPARPHRGSPFPAPIGGAWLSRPPRGGRGVGAAALPAFRRAGAGGGCARGCRDVPAAHLPCRAAGAAALTSWDARNKGLAAAARVPSRLSGAASARQRACAAPKAGGASGRVGIVPCMQSRDALGRAPRFFLSLSVFVARNSACSHNGRILSSDEIQNFLEKSSGLRLAEVLAYLSFLRAENWLTAVTQHAKRDRRDRNL